MAEHLITGLGGDGGYFNPGLAGVVQPGDVIVIPASIGKITYFYGGIIRGAPGNPITIRNRDGQVLVGGGFDMEGWQDVVIDGGGDSNTQYGFRIDSEQPDSVPLTNGALSIHGKAKNIEIKRVWCNNEGYGLWCKNEPSCDPDLNAWVIENIYVHHCKFTHIRVEGTYVGSTNVKTVGGSNVRPIDCGGSQAGIIPPQCGNIRIEDNIFDGTGRGAVQISQASVGLSTVLRNKISNVGRERNEFQGNGINIGGLSRVRIQGNNIDHTLIAGICFFGQYGEILDNVIADSGHMDDLYTPWAWGIWIDTRAQDPSPKSKVHVINNTIGRRGMGDNSNANTTTPDLWADIIIVDQAKGDGTGWETGNIVRGNTSSITGQPAILTLGSGINITDQGNPPEYVPGAPAITSLYAVTPAVVVARVDSSFEAAGINADNTQIIFEVGAPLKSYVPGRSINALTGFTGGRGYYIVPKMNFNITNLLYPPIPTGSLLTTTAFNKAVKKIMSTKI